MRILASLLLVFISLNAHAEGFISRLLHHPVQGGIAVVPLTTTQAPKVRFNNKPVLVINEDNKRWIAIVGIPLTAKAGPHSLEVDGKKLAFRLNIKTTLNNVLP